MGQDCAIVDVEMVRETTQKMVDLMVVVVVKAQQVLVQVQVQVQELRCLCSEDLNQVSRHCLSPPNPQNAKVVERLLPMQQTGPQIVGP
jgi:hypothetical protein